MNCVEQEIETYGLEVTGTSDQWMETYDAWCTETTFVYAVEQEKGICVA